MRKDGGPFPIWPLDYGGAAPETADAILRQGLIADEPPIHPSLHRFRNGAKVGRRKAQTPTILIVNAAAHANGVRFYPSQDEVWLADPIPADYVNVMA